MFFRDSGVDFIGKAGGVGVLMESKLSYCLLELGSFNFALGGYEVRLEARPLFVSCGLGVPFSDVAAKNIGVCDNS